MTASTTRCEYSVQRGLAGTEQLNEHLVCDVIEIIRYREQLGAQYIRWIRDLYTGL